jgi:hypothetical protein
VYWSFSRNLKMMAARWQHLLPCGHRLALSIETPQPRPAGEGVSRRHSNLRTKYFLKICRIPVWPFVVIVKAGQLARLKTIF